jgi:hypothetical protein
LVPQDDLDGSEILSQLFPKKSFLLLGIKIYGMVEEPYIRMKQKFHLHYYPLQIELLMLRD